MHIIVNNAEEPTRIDRWLKKQFANIPVSLIHKFIRKKYIKLNNAKTEPSAKVQNGDQIIINQNWDNITSKTPIKTSAKAPGYNDKLLFIKENIIYKDEHIIVLNKPYSLAVQGGSKISLSIDDLLEDLKFGLNEKPKLVHRLDKDTSGILLLARTNRAAQLLTTGFKQKHIIKKYWAIVVGKPKSNKGVIDLPLNKKPINKTEKVGVDYEEGKDAITEYRIVDHAGQIVSWLEMIPITGRTHQLRVHALSLNTPILGDGKYGGKAAFIVGCSNKLHLHAREIIIKDFMGKTLNFKAPLPKHMQETFKFFEFKE
jgi:23S rRNA pseudouridine955/2504/2580 synthase